MKSTVSRRSSLWGFFAALLLGFCLLFAMMPVSQASAQSAWTYNTLSNGTLQITGYNGNISSMTIPSYIDGRRVTEIGSSAFKKRGTLRSVTIPKTVETVGREAFADCTSLCTLTIQNGVSCLGYLAFSGCTSLTSVTIPGSVTRLGTSSGYSDGYASTFAGCTSLRSVTLQNGVSLIGNNMFSGCRSLTTVSVASSVKSIGEYAFRSCSSLRTITIPTSVESIGSCAFYGCNSLSSVKLQTGLTSIGRGAFQACKSLSSVTIPKTVETVGREAFADCTSLCTLTIQNGVSCLGYLAFSGCTSLTSVTIPGSVTRLGTSSGYSDGYASTFAGCTSLRSVTLQNGVSLIGNNMFSGCRSLTAISIPESVTFFGDRAFNGCTALHTVSIKSGVTSLGSSAFSGCTALRSIVIPGTIPEIGSSAFEGCTSLASAIIQNGVSAIDSYAFYGCSQLTRVSIPSSVTTIGRQAFDKCNRVTLYVQNGSYALTYAKANGIRYSTAALRTVSFVSNGGSSVASQVVANGSKASKPSNPTRSGYTFVGWYSDKNLTKAYNFNTAVKSNITLYAKWKKIVPPTSFKDVPSGQWYTTWVTQAAKAGLMTGTKNPNGTYTGYFEPDRGITRAEVATVLWRIAGSPSSSYSVPSDVRGHWSQTAVAWCASQGVVTGYTSGPYRGKFRPDAQVTREELATMVYRFAKWSGVKTSNPPKKAFNSCGDTSCVSSWARDAMVWCSAAGVITGVQGGSKPLLCPQDGATRAMAAKIFVQTKKLASKSIAPYTEEEGEVPVADAGPAPALEIPTVKPELFFGTTEEGFAYVVVPDGYEAEDGTGFVIDQYYEQLGGRYVGPGAYITGYCGSATSLVLPKSVMAERQKLVEVVGATDVIQADAEVTPGADVVPDADSPVIDVDAAVVAEPQPQMTSMDAAVTTDAAAQTDSDENRSSDGEGAESGSADTSDASAVDGFATGSTPVNDSAPVVSYEVVTESYNAPVVSANLSWGKGRTLDKEADHKVVTGTEEPTDQQAGMDDASHSRIANLSIQRGCALAQLDASGNLITRITLLGDETLGGLPSLRILDLSNTQLESFDTVMFPTLESLSLENCPLSDEALQQLGAWLGATGLTADLNGAGPVSVNANEVPAGAEQPSNTGDDTKAPANSEKPGTATAPEVPSGSVDPTEPSEPAVPAPGDSMEPTEPEPPAQPGDALTPEAPATDGDGPAEAPEMPSDSSMAQGPSDGGISVPSESPKLPDDPVVSSDETAIVLSTGESLFGLAA